MGGFSLLILCFSAVMMFWIVIRIAAAATVFDPDPFILVELVLSTLAAIPAPIIAMSQNWQAARDAILGIEERRGMLPV